jgi:prepilin-type N-terminal cleavage/methylation domain-containing protein
MGSIKQILSDGEHKRMTILSLKRINSKSSCVNALHQRGFTLVEGLVAAIIASLLAGILLMIMRMNNDGVKDGASNAKVQAQYETAITDIGSSVRFATVVVNAAAGETMPVPEGLSNVTTSKIEMWIQDAAGNNTKTRGFWVNNGALMEWRPGWGAYQDFKVGNWPTLTVLDATPFTLSANRKTLTVSMRVNCTFLGATDTAFARGEVFTCRN